MDRLLRVGVITLMALLLTNCGGDSGNKVVPPTNEPDTSAPDYTVPQSKSLDAPLASYELLFIGNSHSALNRFPGLVSKVIEFGSGMSANGFNTPEGSYLIDRALDGPTGETLAARPWTHVVLQAQKYSTSGQFSYSTEGSRRWITASKDINAIPVMYPEHPHFGDTSEGQRLYDLHLGIVQDYGACLAPVPLVWDEVIAQQPGINLHADDGNHFNYAGALLSAMVFYEVITGLSAEALPYIPEVGVNAAQQAQLRQAVSLVINLYPPCDYFP